MDSASRARLFAVSALVIVLLAVAAANLSAPASPLAPVPDLRFAPRAWPQHRPESAARLGAIFQRALDWSGKLDLDPLRLRSEKKMKGIKHFVEYLDLLHLASRSPDETIAARARERAVQILAVVDDGAYHQLTPDDPRRFKEDSLSYVRAGWLAEQFLPDNRRYRRELEKFLPRLHEHFKTRGVDQRMTFAALLGELRLPCQETEAQVYRESLLAARMPLAYFDSPLKTYNLTHEIFALTSRGARTFQFPKPEDARYAKETLAALLKKYMDAGDLDLSAELLIDLAEIGEGGCEIARAARALILRSQNPDGSFGKYDEAAVKKTQPLFDVQIGAYLHTTMVCLWALMETE